MKVKIDYNNWTIRSVHVEDEDGKRNGPYEEYAEDGRLAERGTWVGNKKEGPFERFYQTELGRLTAKGIYLVGRDGLWRCEGPIKSYYASGRLAEEYTLKGLGKEGPYVSYYENGQVAEKCSYKNDRKDGPYESYYPNGQLKEKCIYEDGVAFGLCEEYYENGQLKERCTRKHGPEDGYISFDGVYETYYKNGQLKERCVYKCNEDSSETIIGPHEWYHDNGQLEKIRVYADGSEVGPRIVYNRAGQVIERDGWEYSYYENGKVKERRLSPNHYQKYYENGTLEEDCSYQSYERYYKDGQPAEKRTVTGYRKFFPNGQLAEIGTCTQGEKDGPYKKYSQDGDLIEQGVVRRDVRREINEKLKRIDRQMSPSDLRRAVKRTEVAAFRERYPHWKTNTERVRE